MAACPQTPTQSVLEHGQAVHNEYLKLVEYLTVEPAHNRAKHYPSWLEKYRKNLRSIVSEIEPDTIRDYHVYHDCGKPFCREVDEDGRQHFPDHSNVSASTYQRIRNVEADDLVASWIRADMEVHLLKAANVPRFCARPGAAILLLTGLAEVLANASMFGGHESTSFKIKFKHLDRRGRAICKHLWGA